MINYLLLNRKIVEIKGNDAARLLQGLITQDIELVKTKRALPSLILTNKGRYLLDFFIIYHNNSFFIDISYTDVELLVKTINYYKLKSDIKVNVLHNLNVYAFFKNFPFFKVFPEALKNNTTPYIIIEDPRTPGLGLRIISESPNFINEKNFLSIIDNYFANQSKTLKPSSLEQYNSLRYLLVVPENTELIKEKSIPLEYNLDELNFISFNKGCYLGQEFTNASKRTLIIRKRLVTFEVTTNDSNKTSTTILDNTTIINCHNEPVGTIVGNQSNYILVLTKLDFLKEDTKLYYKNNLIILKIPTWLQKIVSPF